jgi:hypothetical protein
MPEKDQPVRRLAVTPSRCCNAEALLVKSREGGYVSKNCTHCNKSGYAQPSDIEPFECCGKIWPVVIINKNYHWQCGVCQTTAMVADYVPKWSDLFPYSPLIAPGDPRWGDV